MLRHYAERLSHFAWCEVISPYASQVERLPVLWGEVQHLGFSDGEGNDKPVRQRTEDAKQLPFLEVYQTGSIIDDDARH